MFKKLLIFVACSCVLLLSSCDENDNNTSLGTTITVRDLTVYQEQLSEIFEGEFSGTIEDGDYEVPCQYDGRQFVLSLEFASPMSCIEPDDGRKTDCTKAVTGFLALKGGLVIDSDAEIGVTGQVELFNGLSVIEAYLQLHIDGDYRAQSFGERDMESMDFDSVITQLEWSVNHQDTGWEVCVLSISP